MADPVTLAEVQTHLRLGTLDAAEQAELTAMISAATEYAENFCNRSFRSGTQTQLFGSFPTIETDPLVILGNAASVTIQYYDTTNTLVDFTDYRVIPDGGRSLVFPAFGSQWPSDGNGLPYSIVLTYTTTVGSSVPASVKHAVLLLVGDMYENRENSVTGQGVTHVKMSLTAERLLTPYKTRLA